MAEISTFLFFRHLRAERNSYVLRYRKGALVAQGQGLTFWFLPLSASIAEVPGDDQELNFLFNAKSQDFQEVTAQGVVTFRVEDPATGNANRRCLCQRPRSSVSCSSSARLSRATQQGRVSLRG